MRFKIKGVTDELVNRISQWDTVEVVTCTDVSSMDIYDPYFSITLDVYYRNDGIPPGNERRELFSDTNFFESSTVAQKDRFMMNDFPVKIEYKEMNRIEKLITEFDNPDSIYREKGTYLFHRLEQGILLYEQSDWLDSIRKKLQNMPEMFWSIFREASQSRMEHFLNDLGASVYQKDSLFYKISMAGFLKYVCCTLFAINKEFEPSSKRFHELIGKLPVLPAGFMANFEILLRMDDNLPIEKNREVAQLLAKGIIRL